MPTHTIHAGDCLDVLAQLEPTSIDAIVTDPPYGLGMMGKAWDALPPSADWARECLRVLKPGGHLLAFGGTRTWHRLAVAVEDAGFEIRDSIAWVYGEGIPKGIDASKAVDAWLLAGSGAPKFANRMRPEDNSWSMTNAANGGGPQLGAMSSKKYSTSVKREKAATEEAERWVGWYTGLRPAMEPIVVARRPMGDALGRSILRHGVGALNVEQTRIPLAGESDSTVRHAGSPQRSGRFPCNVVVDDGCVHMLDGNDRFFSVVKYEKKAPKRERPNVDGVVHPTVKPLALMRWLVRLVTPPGGVVLDPFAGSGTTVEAALLEGFDVIGIEREPTYLPLIDARIARTTQENTAPSGGMMPDPTTPEGRAELRRLHAECVAAAEPEMTLW